MVGNILRLYGCTSRGKFGCLSLHKCSQFSSKLFSSSSPSNKEPRLSARNQRDLIILSVGILGIFGYYLAHRDNDWENDVWTIQNKLIASSANQNSDDDDDDDRKPFLPESDSLPPPIVLRYVDKVLNRHDASDQPPTPIFKQHYSGAFGDGTGRDLQQSAMIVTVSQSGEFFGGYQWYPFDAMLTIAASISNPGFVWDAKTTILNLSNRVLQYYITLNYFNDDNNDNVNDDDNDSQELRAKTKVKSESNIVTKIWGKYPLIQIEENDPYILFWLAMTPLFPAIFLPCHHHHGKAIVLRWNDNNHIFTTLSDTANTDREGNGRASARLLSDVDGVYTTFMVEFFFGEKDDLLHKITVTSLSRDDSYDGRMKEPWQATYNDYNECVVISGNRANTEIQDLSVQHRDRKSHKILVPSKIEIGKGEGNQYRPHFKISNNHIGLRK